MREKPPRSRAAIDGLPKNIDNYRDLEIGIDMGSTEKELILCKWPGGCNQLTIRKVFEFFFFA